MSTSGHAGAAGGAGHFSLLIVSEGLFRDVRASRGTSGCSASVADLLPHPIHALSIKALAPEEFTSLSPTTKDALR